MTGLLLIPFLSCSSSKRGREESESLVFGNYLNSASSPEVQSLKRQKIELNVLNVSSFGISIYWVEIITLIVEYCPDFRRILRQSSETGRAIIYKYRPYQRKLALNLGINGFFDLPFHPDLKVFENMRIPRTPLGKAVSLTMVYQMITRFLKSSSIAKPLMDLFLVNLQPSFKVIHQLLSFFQQSQDLKAFPTLKVFFFILPESKIFREP